MYHTWNEKRIPVKNKVIENKRGKSVLKKDDTNHLKTKLQVQNIDTFQLSTINEDALNDFIKENKDNKYNNNVNNVNTSPRLSRK